MGMLYLLSVVASCGVAQAVANLTWTCALDGEPGAPIVGPDGTVFVALEPFVIVDQMGNEFCVDVQGDRIPCQCQMAAVEPHTGKTLWSVKNWNPDRTEPEYFIADPSVTSEGSVFFSADGSIFSNEDRLVGLDPDGSLKWVAKGNSPFVCGGGSALYAFTNRSFLTALNPANGSHRWSAPWDLGKGTPACGNDGIIYGERDPTTPHGPGDTAIAAVYPQNGTTKWELHVQATRGVAVAPDNTVYVAYNDYQLGILAISGEGEKKWTHATGGNDAGVPSIGIDGTVYTTSFSKLYAINPDGKRKWTASCGFGCGFTSFAAPVLGTDGTVYVGTEANGVFAYNPANGKLKWNQKLGEGWHVAGMALGLDGCVYAAAWNHHDDTDYLPEGNLYRFD